GSTLLRSPPTATLSVFSRDCACVTAVARPKTRPAEQINLVSLVIVFIYSSQIDYEFQEFILCNFELWQSKFFGNTFKYDANTLSDSALIGRYADNVAVERRAGIELHEPDQIGKVGHERI